jgi:phage terminase large subunit GpA-like protein
MEQQPLKLWEHNLRKAFLEGLTPDPLLTVSEWADQYRMLSPRASAEAGKWRTSRTPYLREIMDCLSSNHPAQVVSFMKGAQVGGTEAGSNWIGYIIDHAPGPMMAVQPTVDMAKRNSKQRIQPLIDECPQLKNKVKASRERDSGNTILMKEFPGGMLVMTGANSAVGLRSLPARYLFLDEIDAYPGDVDGEGDPIALAEARARTFSRRKIFKVSTPTIQGRSRIESAYEASDQRKYEVPCPHCGHFQDLVWKQLRWPPGKPHQAAYFCIECDTKIEEHCKTDMLDRGKWIARNPEPINPRHVAFHLNSLYSPLGWYGWADAAELFEEAKKFPLKLRNFVNTVLGETWKEKGEAPDWHRLYERREQYPMNVVPAGGLFLTAGVDIQKDRIEVEVVAWGRDKQSWSIDYRVIPGHTNEDYCWLQLFEMLNETFQHQCGVGMTIRMMAIDSGFNTQEVYNRVRQHPMNRVMAIKGSDAQQSTVGSPTAVDVDWRGKKIRRGVKVWPVGSSVIKTELYGWLGLNAPTQEGEPYMSGFCHFPEYGEQYFKMLTSEQLIIRVMKNGARKYEWEKIYERNEALDCRLYARAAAAVVGIDRFKAKYWDDLEKQFTVKPIETQQTTVQTGGTQIIRKKRENSFWR